MSLTYERLRAAVDSKVAGIRARTPLTPLGGPGDKVFPPTYRNEATEKAVYARETRRVPGSAGGLGDNGTLEAVVLDSVASQANRLGLSLLEAIRREELNAPVTSADFRVFGDLADLDRISEYEAPHRIFDAILRDSYDGDLVFRLGPTGKAITEASVRNVAALFRHSPVTLLFGGWDSTGPKGGRGAKYERAITSEVVATGITLGSKSASRIDPLGIERKAGDIFEADDELGWTLDKEDAVRDDKGQPKRYARNSRQAEVGRPSQINHGNVTPSVDDQTGGITASEIMATTVLSFIQLRRLRFPTDAEGIAVSGDRRREIEGTARTAVAALGLTATVLAFEEGFDLRSRCVLVPEMDLKFELVSRGGEVEAFELAPGEALALVRDAAAAAAEAGIPWRSDELLLRPSDRLADLVRRSRKVAEGGVESGT